uniref:Uncharacterized protein n=1 Tax=Arundo donax TaxID=35708 RepID=A0A0A9A365_ARUDO
MMISRTLYYYIRQIAVLNARDI